MVAFVRLCLCQFLRVDELMSSLFQLEGQAGMGRC
jgi:hypothetical protein